MSMNDSCSPFFTPVTDVNEDVERTCAELLIYHDTLHPDAVTELLGIAPTKKVAVGEPGKPNSRGRVVVGKVNGWFLSSEGTVDSKDLRRHLDWLITRLRPCAENLRSLQETQGVRMYVFCPWWTRSGGGGPTLWPEQMRGLAELNLECTVSFADYSEGEK